MNWYRAIEMLEGALRNNRYVVSPEGRVGAALDGVVHHTISGSQPPECSFRFASGTTVDARDADPLRPFLLNPIGRSTNLKSRRSQSGSPRCYV